MAFIDGDSHSEIAERLDLPLGTVKGRVRGGLKKLGARLGAGQ
jgi:RNA polymerase sigma-70 factor (ECF subfamily)